MTQSLNIISVRTENLCDEMRTAIIELCVAAHEEEDFRNLFSSIPSGVRHFLAYRAKELASHALVTTRWLQLEGQSLWKTAYIDAVATLPAYQGQGYGSTLIHQLAGDIDHKYVIACLETERETFYQRLGWQTWRGPLAGHSKQGLIPTPEQRGIMVLRLSQTPQLNLDSGLTIECDTPLPLKWRGFLGHARSIEPRSVPMGLSDP